MERKWLSLVAIVTGIFMLLIDVTIVNVALPEIGTDLNSSFSSLEWVVNAYTLTLASSLLVSGSLADLIGRRLVFSAGLVIFTLASLGCGLSESSLMLNLMRAVQGIGGGMMFSTSLAIGVVEQRRSGMASGINATFRQVGIAAGVAGLGAIFQSRVGTILADKLAGTPAAPHSDQISAAVTAGQTDRAISHIPQAAGAAQIDQLRDAAHLAFIGGINTLFLVTAGIALVGAIGAIFLVRQRDFLAPPDHGS